MHPLIRVQYVYNGDLEEKARGPEKIIFLFGLLELGIWLQIQTSRPAPPQKKKIIKNPVFALATWIQANSATYYPVRERIAWRLLEIDLSSFRPISFRR